MKPQSDHQCRWIAAAMMAIVLAAGPAHVIAQADHAPIRVEMPQSAPNISRVAVRGDSVFFWDRFGFLGDAYVYDRRLKNFARVRLPADVIALASRGRGVPYVTGLKLVDSLAIGEVILPDGAPSHRIWVAESWHIALRGPRVAAEQRWRRARRLPAVPEFIADEVGPSTPNDWAPINILSFAIDSSAVWLGLDREYQRFQDFALGGLIRVDRRTLTVSVIEDTAVMRASIAQITPEHVTIANLLGELADSASAPDLRESLDSTEYPSSARIATALALLGDSAGIRWVRQALDDTLRQSASGDSAQRIRH